MLDGNFTYRQRPLERSMQETSWRRGASPSVCWGKEAGGLGKPSASAPTKNTGMGQDSQAGHSIKLNCIVLRRGQKGSPGLSLSASPKYGFGKDSPRKNRAL